MSLRLRQSALSFLQIPRLRRLMLIPMILLAVGAPFVVLGSSNAVQLGFWQLQLSDGTTDATGVRYNFSFNTNTNGPLGSVVFRVCSNYLHNVGDPCTPPVGFNAAAASITNQTGVTDFSLNPASNGYKLVVSRPVASVVAPQQLTIEFSGITNPSAIGSNYVRIDTYASRDGSGPNTDYGIVVFATNQGIGITTEVPPYLLFCTGITIDGYNCGTATGSFISFGELSNTTTRSATSQLLASTNAPYGYSVTLAGSTMTAGTNVITAMSGDTSRPGTSQFGINSRSNSVPVVGSEPEGPGLTVPRAAYNTPNTFRFGSGDIIASSNDTDDYRKLTMSYIVNVNKGQPPGRYVATVSYICVANF